MISQTRYLFVAMVLFLLGLSGIFLNRKNIIILLMSIELMLLSINFNFIIFSVFLDDILGQLFALLVLNVAAAESAIGLAILVIYYRVRGTIAIEFINLMKGMYNILKLCYHRFQSAILTWKNFLGPDSPSLKLS